METRRRQSRRETRHLQDLALHHGLCERELQGRARPGCEARRHRTFSSCRECSISFWWWHFDPIHSLASHLLRKKLGLKTLRAVIRKTTNQFLTSLPQIKSNNPLISTFGRYELHTLPFIYKHKMPKQIMFIDPMGLYFLCVMTGVLIFLVLLLYAE